MTDYLRCIRKSRGVNQEECRMMSKAYLQCRMDKNLMAHDEMKNLGYGKDGAGDVGSEQEELRKTAESTRRQAGG